MISYYFNSLLEREREANIVTDNYEQIVLKMYWRKGNRFSRGRLPEMFLLRTPNEETRIETLNNHHLENPSVIDRLLPWSKELPEQCRMKRNRKKCLKQ